MLPTREQRNLSAIQVLLLNCGDHRSHSKDGHALFYPGQFVGMQLSAVSRGNSNGAGARTYLKLKNDVTVCVVTVVFESGVGKRPGKYPNPAAVMVLAFKFWGAPVVMHVLSLPCLSNEPLAGVDHSHRVLSFEVHLAGRQSRTTKTRGCPDFSVLAGIFFHA